jgi:sulfur carrier protein ThiS
MKLFVEKDAKTKNIKFSGSAESLLKKLKINPEEVIISCNNEIITLDEKISDKDEVSILSVISGG